MQFDVPEGFNEAKSIFFTKGEIGDNIKGTYTGVRDERVNNLSPTKELQAIYELQAISGWHNVKDKETKKMKKVAFTSDDVVSVAFTKDSFSDKTMKKLKAGQQVLVRFEGTKPATQPGYNDIKIVKIYPGPVDASYGFVEAVDPESEIPV